MTDHRSILEQIITQFVGRAASVLLGVAVLAATTRLLGPTLFGVYGTALAYLQLFGILMDFGLTVTTLDVLAKSSEQQQKRLIGSLVTLRSLLSTLTTIAAFLILELFPYPVETRQAVYLASLLFILYSFQQLFTSVFQYKKNTTPIVIAEVIGRVATLVGLWVVALYGGGLLGVIGAGISGNLVVVVVMSQWSRRFIAWRASLDHSQWREILCRSWPIGLSIAFNLVYFKADTIILSFLSAPDVVGLYAAPYKILEVLISFPPLFLGMVLPQWSMALQRNDPLSFQKWMHWALSLTAMIVVPLVLGTLALATPVMTFVAGSAFAASGPLLQILVLATGIIFFSNVFGYAVVALERQKAMIPFYCIAAVACLGAYTAAIVGWGAMGAAWTTVGIELFMLAVGICIVRKHTRGSLLIPNLTKYIISGVIMFFTLLIVRGVIHILLSVFVGIITYGVVLYCLGGFSYLYVKPIFQQFQNGKKG